MKSGIVIAQLRNHPECLPTLAEWFRTEWPTWYGPGGPGNADDDLRTYCNTDSLPMGVVALSEGAPCGVAVLKVDAISSRPELSPVASAGFVKPALRGLGIGAALLQALEGEAKTLGYDKIYCATATSASLLMRSGWQFIEKISMNGDEVEVFGKVLR